ncbi:MAG TPA: type II toxin-antitoxin system VapC family toxin [Acidobacteriaceae bacterium]|nr:type II toxin-antitoxin system VapC family toxin [Acidobacteriaceae bacterium]
MSRVVFDASAILAAVNREPGADLVVRYTESSLVSTVNLAEVQGKLVTRGISPDDAWEAALSLCNEVVPFDSHQARLTGALLATTKTFGLSLGDRACLALAILLKAPVYTTDRLWKRLSLGVEIRLLR